MKNEVINSNGILDIIAPVIPEGELVYSIIIFVIFAVTSALALILWRMFMTSKGKARRRLKNLYQQYKNLSESEITTVFNLANIVKDGLELTCLSFYRVTPHSHQPQGPEWELFVRELDAARYSSTPLSGNKIMQLMNEAKRWIK